MARHRSGGGAKALPQTPLTRQKVREVVTAIAAEVIAETAQRLRNAPRPKAAALRIGAKTRSVRKPA